MKSNVRQALSIGLAVASAAPVVKASAQEGTVLEEITVTAARRAENVQDVPISIMAVTGETLSLQGVTSIQNLNGTIPNLNVVGGLGGNTGSNFAVRGIPRVGLYIDGVWQASSQAMMDYNFVDVERLEVLRGPQGTLYGRDSTGGAIRIVTKTPAQEFGAELGLTAGTFDRNDVNLAIDIPLSDTVRTRWTAAQLKRGGFVHSLTTNDYLGQIDQTFARGTVTWEPTDRFEMRINYQTSESHPTDARIVNAVLPEIARSQPSVFSASVGIVELYTLAGAPYTNETQTAGYPGGTVGEFESRQNITTPGAFTRDQGSVNITYDINDNITFESWTSATKQTGHWFSDWDTSQYDAFEDVNHSKFRLFSQEFQISGTNGPVDWVAGAFYWNQAQTNRQTRWGVTEFRTGELSAANVFAAPQCNPPIGLLNCQTSYGIYLGALATDAMTLAKEDGSALFGEVAIALTDKLELTVGARYHDQDLESTPLRVTPGITATRSILEYANPVGGDPLAGVPILTDAASFDKTTARIVISRDFSDSVMGYFSFSQGFNSGGLAAVNFSDSCPAGGRRTFPFMPETLENYELGFRSDLADGRLRFNATVFHTEWQDIQLNNDVFDPCTGTIALSPRLQNAGAAEAKGLEFEITLAATEEIQVTANIGLLDTAYTSVLPGVVSLDTGSEFAQAPEETYALGFQHTANFGNGGRFVSRLDYMYTGGFERYRVPTYHPSAWGLPGDEAGDYGLVNARFAYSPPGSRWEMAAFGTNLTNERYLTSGILHGIWQTDWGNLGRPREAGIELKVFLQ